MERLEFPHNLDAERAVLGGVLLHNDVFVQIAAVLPDAAEFYRDAHQRIFRGMQRLHAGGVVVDWMTLNDALTRTGELDEIGGPAYLAKLVDGLPPHANVRAYAEMVHEYSILRQTITVGHQIVETAISHEQDAVAIAESGARRLMQMVKRHNGVALTAVQAATGYLARLESSDFHRWQTGFLDLDKITGGLRAGEYTVIGGRPSMGKSSLALGIGRALARAQIPTLMFSREMDSDSLVGRLLGYDSHVASTTVERGEASDSELTRVSTAWQALEGLPLWIDTEAGTLTQIEAACEQHKANGGLSCILVDYLQLLVPERRQESREREVALISQGLRSLAKRLRLSVVALAQLSRAPDKRRDKRPRMSDLRESGNIDADADVVILVHRAEYYSPKPENKGIAELIVAKQRSGPTGVAKLAFVKELAMFANLEAHQQEEEGVF